jgi:hypothetical protein
MTLNRIASAISIIKICSLLFIFISTVFHLENLSKYDPFFLAYLPCSSILLFLLAFFKFRKVTMSLKERFLWASFMALAQVETAYLYSLNFWIQPLEDS